MAARQHFACINQAKQFCKLCGLVLSFPQCPNRSLLWWAQSLVLLSLIACQSFGRQTQVTVRWHQRVSSFIPQLREYTFERYSQSHAVYLKLPLDVAACRGFALRSNVSYIGCSSVGIKSREANRIAKYHQLSRDDLVKVEPALQYWWFHRSYFNFPP